MDISGPKIELPTLYSMGAAGHMLYWRVSTEGDIVVFEYGAVDGKPITYRTRSEATNVGRSNERLGPAQAEFEAQAAWTKKTKQGYLESIESARTAKIILPMLAHPINKKTKVGGVLQQVVERKVMFPCAVQPKLNGLRGLSIRTDFVTMKSRLGTIWETLTHIEEATHLLTEAGDMVDGEVYLHGLPLQIINGWVKNRSDPAVIPLRATLQYHIYDMPMSQGGSFPWEKRLLQLKQRYREVAAKVTNGFTIPIEKTVLAPIRIVPTYMVKSREELDQLCKSFVLDGYEGGIIRHFGREYEFDHRTEAMLKWKQFIDTEFRVVDIRSREYFEPGSTINSYMILDKCVCQNNLTADTFEVVPTGPIWLKKQWHQERETLIGKRLVVRYLERSVDGIPQGNPVGVAFRLDEDSTGVDDEDVDPWE